MMLVTYIPNFVDRSLLSVVARPLKADLGIGDTAFGLLTGVGIGEAGCTPPANSHIADYFPPLQRPTALGYYAISFETSIPQ